MLVALDQALAHTGWACLRADSVWVGELVTTPDTNLWERLLVLEQAVQALWAAGASPLIIEAIYGRHPDLIRVQTVIHMTSMHQGKQPLVISAHPHCHSSWRAALGLPGGKKPVQQWAKATWGKTLSTHRADALGILFGWCAREQVPVCPGEHPLIDTGTHDRLDHLF